MNGISVTSELNIDRPPTLPRCGIPYRELSRLRQEVADAGNWSLTAERHSSMTTLCVGVFGSAIVGAIITLGTPVWWKYIVTCIVSGGFAVVAGLYATASRQHRTSSNKRVAASIDDMVETHGVRTAGAQVYWDTIEEKAVSSKGGRLSGRS
jgi:hypothetical protein